jgi:hypothetical protein
MKNRTFHVSVPFVLARLFIFLALTGAISHPASAQPNTPTHLRVDISDGNSGQLFISWDKMSGATYYDLQHSLSQTSGYQQVTNCYGSANSGYNDTPFQTEVCRDSGLAVGTPYYYEVAACNSSQQCSPYTSTTNPPPPSNTPVSCN